jgi:hypothetical protein
VVTCEHANFATSPNPLQSIGGGGELGEPGKHRPDIPGPTTLEDPRAGAVSPGAALDEIMHMFAASSVYIQMSPWHPPFTMMGRQGSATALKITLSRG